MRLAKSILGAVVGGILGVGLLVVVEAVAGREYGWIVIFVGLLTGLSMRMIAGSDRASYLRGGLAALVALAAFIGGKYVVAAVVSQRSPQEALVAAAAQSGAGDLADDVPADNGAAAPALMPPRLDAMLPVARPTPAGLQRLSPLDAVWLVIGALVAYELGRGRDKSIGHSPKADNGSNDLDGASAS